MKLVLYFVFPDFLGENFPEIHLLYLPPTYNQQKLNMLRELDMLL